AAQGTLPPLGVGDTFDVQIPSDIISGRMGPFEPGQPRYGLYIVFFAVCAGTLDFDMDAQPDAVGSTGLPIRCLDDDGKPLASEDFVVGYSSIYSFKGVSNENPVFTLDDAGQGSFLVAGSELAADCVGDACQGAAAVEAIDCDADGEKRCIDACED